MATNKWWTSSTVAVVTGANRGIGKEIARILATQGFTVVATARSEAQGKAAVEELASAAGSSGGTVLFHPLDVNDSASHVALKGWLQQRFGQQQPLSVLVNNGAIAFKGDVFGPQELRATLATNYTGTANLTEALLPLLKPQEGRVVTVSSRAGLLGNLRSQALRDRFAQASSRAELDQLADEFVALVDQGADLAAAGWPRSMYGISKALISMDMRVLAKQVEAQGIKVAACCPGWCRTDMSSGGGNKSAAEGADTPAWLAMAPWEELQTGLLWGERTALSY